MRKHNYYPDTLEEAKIEIDKLRDAVVFGFYEEKYPSYTQGFEEGAHELTSEVTANECNHLIGMVKDLEERLKAANLLVDQAERIKTIVRHIFAEKTGVYFICGESGDKDRDGLPDRILVCPEAGADVIAIYTKSDVSTNMHGSD